LTLALLACCLAVPAFVSFGTEDWAAILQGMPYVGTAALTPRWWVTWIVPLLILTAFAFDHIRWLGRRRPAAAAILIGLAVAQFSLTNRDYYLTTAATYNPLPMQAADHRLRKTGKVVGIEMAGPIAIQAGPDGSPLGRNDGIALGYATFRCYEPLFGYRLENFPAKIPAIPASVETVQDGALALSDPFCYFGTAIAGCEPGTRFTTADSDAFEQFIQYRPLPDRIPPLDRPVRQLALIAGILVIIAVSAGSLAALRLAKGFGIFRLNSRFQQSDS
jgi:hypothetical protein